MDSLSQSKPSASSSSLFSPELTEFYRSHGIDLQSLSSSSSSSSSSSLLSCPYRFVRLNPGHNVDETLKQLSAELLQQQKGRHGDQQTLPLPVDWIDRSWGFYAMPSNFSLTIPSRTPETVDSPSCFQSGRCYGMDVSSGVAVSVLLTRDHDKVVDNSDGSLGGSSNCNDDSDNRSIQNLIISRNKRTSKENDDVDNGNGIDDRSRRIRVLDLCCAPGLKICQIADHFLRTQSKKITVFTAESTPTDHHQSEDAIHNGDHNNCCNVEIVGVDISAPRMDVCKKILHKYLVDPMTCGIYKRRYNERQYQQQQNQRKQQQSTVHTPEGHRREDFTRVDHPSSPIISTNDNTKENDHDKHSTRIGNINVQMFLHDGTTFGRRLSKDSKSNAQSPSICEQLSHSLVFDLNASREEDYHDGNDLDPIETPSSSTVNSKRSRKRTNKSARGRQRKRLRQIAERSSKHDWWWGSEDREEFTCTMTGSDDNKHIQSESTEVSHHVSEFNNPILPLLNDDKAVLHLPQSIQQQPQEVQQDHQQLYQYPPRPAFDFVLVDAECSTDGSFKHIRERLKEHQHLDHQTFEQQQEKKKETNPLLLDPSRLNELCSLQRRLIQNGFTHLKPGGSLVYSTCSLSTRQNEDIVNWLLLTNPNDAYVIPIHFPSLTKTDHGPTRGSSSHNGNRQFVVETPQGMVRFYPNLSHDSFVEESFDTSHEDTYSPRDLPDLHCPKAGTAQDPSYRTQLNTTPQVLLGDGFFVAKIGKKSVEATI